MESRTDSDFRKCLSAMPREARKAAIEDYRLWKDDPFANSLHFKPANAKKTVWSVRAGIGWRAFGARREDVMVWYWIGSHEAYNGKIKNVKKKNTTNVQDKAANRE